MTSGNGSGNGNVDVDMHRQGAGRGCRWRVPAAMWLVAVLAAPFAWGNPSGAPAGSLEEAVARVEQAQGGQVLSARSERLDGRLVYRIRILTQDRQVREFEIPGPEAPPP
jgi:uncharacterized membrane protein YkoI